MGATILKVSVMLLILLCGIFLLLQNKSIPKIYDIVTYNCEYGLLEWRIRTLEHVVDHFVLVEGQETFQTGQYKDPCVVSKHSKVMHLYVPKSGKSRPWLREKFARQYALQSFSLIGIRNNDIVISADVDEVPRPDIVRLFNGESAILEMDYFRFNLSNKQASPYSHKAVIARAWYYKRANVFRGGKTESVIQNAGWHCSFCFMSDAEIKRKLQMYSHF